MQIIGLTGSIGMGKSTVAGMLRRLCVPVYCADEAVHALLAPCGAAVAAIGEKFPQSLRRDAQGRPFIDRIALGAVVFQDRAQMKILETIVHPAVRRAEKQFLQRCQRARAKRVVLDIPLLFETRIADVRRGYFRRVIVVTAPTFLQAQRVLARSGMTRETFTAILKKQMPDARKRRLADALLQTGAGRAATLKKLRQILDKP